MKSKIKVTATKRGVRFAIDQQSFDLKMPENDPSEMSAIAYHRWYARQLRIALRRLAKQGL